MISRSTRNVGPISAASLAITALWAMLACRPPRTASTPVAARPQASRTDPVDGTDVIRAMHDRYASTWYRTLTFSQTTTIQRPNGTLVQQWLEAGKFPGRLRIDTDTAARDGVIYANDSLYGFTSGKLSAARAEMNELLILGFDVYTQPAERTASVLRGRGIDLSKVSRASWNGQPMFVVGASAGDSTSKQFWVDTDRLLFVRLIESVPTPSGRQQQEYRFQRYTPRAGGWVAEEVVGLRNGRQNFHEEYANVHVGVPLDDATFDPVQWSTFTPWYRR
jgi:hypothetical protein